MARSDDPTQTVLGLVATLLSELHGRNAVQPQLDSRLDADLGLDSLARVELNLRIARAFGNPAAADALIRADTVRDLLAAIGNADAKSGPVPQRVVAQAEVGWPEQAATLTEVLAWHVQRHPQRLHVSFLPDESAIETLSYGQLDVRARGCAAAFRRTGLERGGHVALMLDSSLDFFCAFIGTQLAGGVPVPIYPPAKASQIEEHLRRQARTLANCEARLLISAPQARPLAQLMKALAPSVRAVLTPADLKSSAGADFEQAVVAADDVAFLQYTSGSTGQPKGVILTHAQLLANLRAMGKAARVGSDDVFVSWLPLYHDMGLIGAWMGSLTFGMSLVLLPPLAFLARPPRWLRAISDFRGTISAAPNFAYELAASRIADEDLAGLDLSSWRLAFNGAEAVSAETLTRFSRRFARHGLASGALMPVYGLAECGLDLTFPPPGRGVRTDCVDRALLATTGRALPVARDNSNAQHLVANGPPLPGYEIRIVDESRRALAERSQGHIEFRGPSATDGYWRNPQATAELLHDQPPQHAWRDSGDLGYLAGGELYVTGRAKDLIIRAGHNLHPAELEEAVGALDGVRRGCVAVFGAPDPLHATERVIVVAETRLADPQARELLRRSIQQLATSLLGGPADEVVLAAPGTVLKTSSGKLRRAQMRSAWLAGTLGATPSPPWRQFLHLAWAGAAARTGRLVQGLAGACYAAWAWSVFVVLGLVAIAALALLPDPVLRRALVRRLARLGLALCAIRLRIDGPDRLSDEPQVVIANHASYLDGIVLTAALPPHHVFVAKAELREQPLIGWPLARLGCRFAVRGDLEQSGRLLATLTEELRRRRSPVLFPEGTFGSDLALRPFQLGAFELAAATGVALQPLALSGTRTVLAELRRPRPGTVRLRIGAPLHAAGRGWDAAVHLRQQARAEMEALLAQQRD
jgi:1-acyl-sn-glycerol-3-phosphate acyltransferase